MSHPFNRLLYIPNLITFGIVSRFSANRDVDPGWVAKIAMTAFASPINKTRRKQLIDEFPDFERHLLWYHSGTISSKQGARTAA